MFSHMLKCTCWRLVTHAQTWPGIVQCTDSVVFLRCVEIMHMCRYIVAHLHKNVECHPAPYTLPCTLPHTEFPRTLDFPTFPAPKFYMCPYWCSVSRYEGMTDYCIGQHWTIPVIHKTVALGTRSEGVGISFKSSLLMPFAMQRLLDVPSCYIIIMEKTEAGHQWPLYPRNTLGIITLNYIQLY